MRNNDVHISGSGGAFQRAQRQNISKVFRTASKKACFITLPHALWKIFDYVKVELEMSDDELVTYYSDIAEAEQLRNQKSFAANMQEVIEMMLQLYRNGLQRRSFVAAFHLEPLQFYSSGY